MRRIDVIRDRRKQDRKSVKLIFLFKMGRLFNGRGMIKDITSGGLCLVCPTLFSLSRKMKPDEYIGSTIQIMIPSATVTVNGTVAWVDLKKGEGGVKLTTVSDEARWKELYETS
ncbi:MAG TPA: PilZ domain-containing protein [Deltaproteobacteria bacterium]|nr:PilZ domain-containing protein [Deltaproteobacteria bacterium]HQI02331.1 PilZ domain-containing protein [Deltaproteobacteria bacterium]